MASATGGTPGRQGLNPQKGVSLTSTGNPEYASPVTPPSRASGSAGGRRRDASLTARESEILGLLATGLSGADIAGQLVLSPETVRTHVRNAMAKLGASTRSQAVALALQRNEISDANAEPEAGPPVPNPARARLGAPTAAFAAVPDAPAKAADLQGIVDGLVDLHEVDAASVYLADEDGMTLRRTASSGGTGTALAAAPEVLALGEGPIGRAALERRAQLVLLDQPAAEASHRPHRSRRPDGRRAARGHHVLRRSREPPRRTGRAPPRAGVRDAPRRGPRGRPQRRRAPTGDRARAVQGLLDRHHRRLSAGEPVRSDSSESSM